MAKVELIIRMKYRWWLAPALRVYLWTCILTASEIDERLIEDAMWRACIVKMSGGKWRPLHELLNDA